MSYDPKLYLIKYSVNDEYEDDVFQAEDAYEAISQLHINVPNANVDAVYVLGITYILLVILHL